MIIPKQRIPEMTEDVKVESLYPNIQIDVFRGDNICYIVSTKFCKRLYYEYYYFTKECDEGKIDGILIKMKNNLKNVVLKDIK